MVCVNVSSASPQLQTARTRLRQWRDSDREPFAALCTDPVVMEYFPRTLTRIESDAFIDQRVIELNDLGWSLWAVELTSTGEFAGFVGLTDVTIAAPFTPCIEIGWRLARRFWGVGIATEAAQCVLEFGFGPLGFHEIVSFTALENLRSQRVMQKLGMHTDVAENFDHPRVPVGHRLRRHVLYRIVPGDMTNISRE
jgi:RimJ/RimL family protein N-acetyltransferase